MSFKKLIHAKYFNNTNNNNSILTNSDNLDYSDISDDSYDSDNTDNLNYISNSDDSNNFDYSYKSDDINNNIFIDDKPEKICIITKLFNLVKQKIKKNKSGKGIIINSDNINNSNDINYQYSIEDLLNEIN